MRTRLARRATVFAVRLTLRWACATAFLAPAIAGDYVAAIAVSEPHAGSDVAAIKTTAKKDGDDYVINGTKMWITNSTQADFFCLLANTSDEGPYNNKSLIVVPSKTPGISIAVTNCFLRSIFSACSMNSSHSLSG